MAHPANSRFLPDHRLLSWPIEVLRDSDLTKSSHNAQNPSMSVIASRVENRRSGFSLPVAVGDAFASPASIRFGVTLFPVPAHRTGRGGETFEGKEGHPGLFLVV